MKKVSKTHFNPNPHPDPSPPGSGAGVDVYGFPVRDPTDNVLAIVEANNLRLEQIRAADIRYNTDMRAAESRRVDEQARLRADFQNDIQILIEKLGDKESRRIDAIRAVDVNAVSVANERAVQQANVLATQLTASADALRGLVAATAATNAEAVKQLNQQFTDRLSLLEKSQYESKGKSAVADPALADFMTAMRKVTEDQSKTVTTVLETLSSRKGKGEGANSLWGYMVGAVGLIVLVIEIIQRLK